MVDGMARCRALRFPHRVRSASNFGLYAPQFVPPGGDPDAHLVLANAEITKLTPPKSFEE